MQKSNSKKINGSWRMNKPYSVRKRKTLQLPTLLLVDDDVQVLKVAKRLLGTEWIVETATNANEAALLLSKNSYDTILTDFEMPGNNGIWLLNVVKETQPHIRRVLFSGSQPNDLPQHMGSGLVECFVAKPTNRKELIESLR